jgi:hypothetical protein
MLKEKKYMKRMFIILVIAGLSAAGACSSGWNPGSGRKCRAMKDGQMTKDKDCLKADKSKNYPVRGY